MPVASKFVLIVGDSPIVIGDSNQVWESNFNTSGRDADQPAFLLLNVSHLTHSEHDVVVSINGHQVGVITTYRPGGYDIDTTDINQPAKWRQADHKYTQMIGFPGDKINDGHNTIQILAVEYPEQSGGNHFDDFMLSNAYCFFQQSA
jgi:hypothetical protein